MPLELNNIFEKIPAALKEEIFEPIIENPGFKLERIVSEAHPSPPDFWYDQDWNEFVILLQGSAELSFQDEDQVMLKPGDYIIIPANKKHRVEWTDKSQKTIWLALHY